MDWICALLAPCGMAPRCLSALTNATSFGGQNCGPAAASADWAPMASVTSTASAMDRNMRLRKVSPFAQVTEGTPLGADPPLTVRRLQAPLATEV